MNRTQTSAAVARTRAGIPIQSISVIIPAYNDETTIARLIQDTDCLLKEISDDYEIVVINDGSKDNTWNVLQDLAKKVKSLRLINHEQNKGFGKTIKELYYAGSKELVFSLPGDYQFAPKELLTMAKGLHKHDLIIGHRVNRNDPPRRKLQSAIYNLMLRIFYGCGLKDVNSIKLFRKEILDRVTLESDTPFVDAELCIRTYRAGFKVVEIPIEHLPRLSQGASGGKFSVIWETFSDLMKMSFRI
ncbi:MAG: glycosyltransferase family 2 protein [Candidatus Obscuribacterales bacterium]|jgi:glycosyltransferase involved in cell wall biosynthesis|nr:glycosyltransferase family 2 protein [Candidatus Obscuribacterales bacterium]